MRLNKVLRTAGVVALACTFLGTASVSIRAVDSDSKDTSTNESENDNSKSEDKEGEDTKKDGFVTVGGKQYWYENGVKQGVKYDEDGNIDVTYRGKEIYDPETDAWYWLDNIQEGAVAKSKDVYQESLAGEWGDKEETDEDGNVVKYGKWVRYDENGGMVKGWQVTNDGAYYFDKQYGTMAKGKAVIPEEDYYVSALFNEKTGIGYSGWATLGKKAFWYENGVRQGLRLTEDKEPVSDYRGKEIYDPDSDAWYWLDNIQDGAVAKGKDVYQESLAGEWGDIEKIDEDGNVVKYGKWVRYDDDGKMIKGWQETEEGTYYFDEQYGTMAKGEAIIDGKKYTFDKTTGKLVKEDPVDDEGNKYTSKGFLIEEKDGITYVDGIMIVNKTYGLPESYNPGGLYPEVRAAFSRMEDDALAQGLKLWIQSGFRTYARQKYLYEMYVEQDGKEAADRYSARPGYSEHQSGYTFDLNTIEESFGYTDEGRWVAEHAHEYGFIVRYPDGHEDHTGYMYESWHLRYVGEELATKVYESGLCLEEYFGITSEYQD